MKNSRIGTALAFALSLTFLVRPAISSKGQSRIVLIYDLALVILAFFWVPWHLSLWQSQGQAVTTWSFWITNGTLIILSSIVTAWFYNHSKGSILVAGIVHAAENTTARLLLIQDWYMYLGLKMVVALVIIVVDQMWKKLPSDHPAVYREPALDG